MKIVPINSCCTAAFAAAATTYQLQQLQEQEQQQQEQFSLLLHYLAPDLLPVILSYLPLGDRCRFMYSCSHSLHRQIQVANHGFGPNNVSLLPTSLCVCVTKTGGLSQLDLLVHNMIDRLLPRTIHLPPSSLSSSSIEFNHSRAEASRELPSHGGDKLTPIGGQNLNCDFAKSISVATTTVGKTHAAQYNTVFDIHVHRNQLCTPKEYHVYPDSGFAYPARNSACPYADFQICVIGETSSDFVQTMRRYASSTQSWFTDNCIFINLCTCEDMSRLLEEYCSEHRYNYFRMDKSMSLTQMEHVLRQVVTNGLRNDPNDLVIPDRLIDQYIAQSHGVYMSEDVNTRMSGVPSASTMRRYEFTDQLFQFMAHEMILGGAGSVRHLMYEMMTWGRPTSKLKSVEDLNFFSMYHDKKFDLAKLLGKLGWKAWSMDLKLQIVTKIANDILFASDSTRTVHGRAPHSKLVDFIARNELEYHEPLYEVAENDHISVKWWSFTPTGATSSSGRFKWNKCTIYNFQVRFPLRSPFTMRGDYQPRTLHQLVMKESTHWCKLM